MGATPAEETGWTSRTGSSGCAVAVTEYSIAIRDER